jgi:hypothetical protein
MMNFILVFRERERERERETGRVEMRNKDERPPTDSRYNWRNIMLL